eukprot:scaffold50676_cov58-Phaeocystis_antarctica.AAC.3
MRRSTAQSGSPVPAASARGVLAWAHSAAPGGGVLRATQCSPVAVADASARVGIATTEPATTAAASQGRARATRLEPRRAGGVVQSCSGVQRALCRCTGSARCAARKPVAVPMQQNTKSANGDDGCGISEAAAKVCKGGKSQATRM